MTDIQALQPLFYISMACFAIGGLGSLISMKKPAVANWWGHAWAAAGSLFGVIVGLGVLISGQVLTLSSGLDLEFFNPVVRIDAFSALFVTLISSIALLASIYGAGYMNKF